MDPGVIGVLGAVVKQIVSTTETEVATILQHKFGGLSCPTDQLGL